AGSYPAVGSLASRTASTRNDATATTRTRTRSHRGVLGKPRRGRKGQNVAPRVNELTRRNVSGRPQPQLARDRAQRSDHERDVLVEVDSELLRALVDVLAPDARRERRLLHLLLD